MVVSHHMGVGTEFRSSGRATNAPEPQVTTPLKLYMHTVAHAYIYTIMSKSNEIMKAQQLVLGLQSPKEEMMRPGISCRIPVTCNRRVTLALAKWPYPNTSLTPGLIRCQTPRASQAEDRCVSSIR